MFCRVCGGESFDSGGKCLKCGWSKVAPAKKAVKRPTGKADPEALFHQSEEQITPGIVRGQDGVYRWIYEMSLWRNPTVLISTAKALLLSCGIVAVLIFFISLGDGPLEALQRAGFVLGIMVGIMSGLLLLGYAVYALISGGKYIVLFEMDDKGVTHRQLQKQFNRVKNLAGIGILLGIASGNISATAVSYNAATRSSMHSGFGSVKKAVIAPRRHVIYLGETLSRNQVYAKPEDFGFVRDYITQRLGSNAEVTQK